MKTIVITLSENQYEKLLEVLNDYNDRGPDGMGYPSDELSELRIAVEAAFRGISEIEHLRALLNPRVWTREMHDAWHKELPDVQAAFDALRNSK